MPIMPDNYYDRFDAEKNYEKILYRAGYTLQSAELNEQQSMAARRLRDVADALFKDGDVIRDASVLVDPASGLVRAAAGAVYLRGAVRGVAPAEFTIPTSGTVAIGVRLMESVVSELDDPSLYNPAIGSRGEGEPGAWRLRVQTAWGLGQRWRRRGIFRRVHGGQRGTAGQGSAARTGQLRPEHRPL